MDILIIIIGIVIMIMGVAYFAEPKIMKWLLNFFRQGERIYIAGIMRLVLGIIFLLSARQCDMTWIIILISIVFIAGSLLIFVLGPRRLNPIIEWWEKLPVWVLRILAVVMLAFGGLIIYAA